MIINQFYRDSVHYGGYKHRIMKDSSYRRHVDQAARQALKLYESKSQSFYKAYMEAAAVQNVLPVDVMLRMYEIGAYEADTLDAMNKTNEV